MKTHTRNMVETMKEIKESGTGHQIAVILDGKMYAGEWPEPNCGIRFIDTMFENMETMVKFSLTLEDGSTMIIGRDAVQRAVFLFNHMGGKSAKSLSASQRAEP